MGDHESQKIKTMAKSTKKRPVKPVYPKLSKEQTDAESREVRCLNKIKKALEEENCFAYIWPNPVSLGNIQQRVEIRANSIVKSQT